MITRTIICVAVMCILSGAAQAASLIAAHAIPARSIISAEDVRISARISPGALTALDDAIGMETSVTIYSGRPLRAADIGPPALIERNEIVRLRLSVGSLIIEADGRALNRGGAGDTISIMNLSYRSTIVGRVIPKGLVEVTR